MKLIIDIPEEKYKQIINHYKGSNVRPKDYEIAIMNGTPLEEELEKIIAKIDFEEKWLIDIKVNNGFISIADIEVAMSGIRSVIAELKGVNDDNK